MQRLRRLAVIGLLVVSGLVGATPALAAVPTAPAAADSIRFGVPASVPGAEVADPPAPTTTIAPPVIDVNPTSEGMPGANLIRQLLSWLSQLALWGSLASILAGATVYGLAQNAANYNGAYRGKQLAVAGAIGAALAGLAPIAISMLFKAARAG